jgi:hypothetical protein
MECAKPQKKQSWKIHICIQNEVHLSIPFMVFLNAVFATYLRHLPCQWDGGGFEKQKINAWMWFAEPPDTNHPLFWLTVLNFLNISLPFSSYLVVFSSSSVVILIAVPQPGVWNRSSEGWVSESRTCPLRHRAAFTEWWEADNWSRLTDIPSYAASVCIVLEEATYIKPGIAGSLCSIWVSC